MHRIGRTARAGGTGTAYTFFTTKNASKARDLISVLEEAKQEVPPRLRDMAASSYSGGGTWRGWVCGGQGREAKSCRGAGRRALRLVCLPSIISQRCFFVVVAACVALARAVLAPVVLVCFFFFFFSFCPFSSRLDMKIANTRPFLQAAWRLAYGRQYCSAPCAAAMSEIGVQGPSDPSVVHLSFSRVYFLPLCGVARL